MRWRILLLSLSLSVACGLIGMTIRSLKADEPKEAQKPAKEADQAEKPKEAAKPPAVNPLQDLFQKLMPRQNPQQIGQPPRANVNPRVAVPRVQSLDPDARDQIDVRRERSQTGGTAAQGERLGTS